MFFIYRPFIGHLLATYWLLIGYFSGAAATGDTSQRPFLFEPRRTNSPAVFKEVIPFLTPLTERPVSSLTSAMVNNPFLRNASKTIFSDLESGGVSASVSSMCVPSCSVTVRSKHLSIKVTNGVLSARLSLSAMAA